MTILGRIVAFLFAMLVGAFGGPWAGATPLSLSPEHGQAYGHSHHLHSATIHKIIERGLPGQTSPFVADELGMRWVSLRSLAAWKLVPPTYDPRARILASPRSRGYNDGQGAAECGPFVRQQARVVAKRGWASALRTRL